MQLRDRGIQAFETAAAWDGATLRNDDSWVFRLTDAHRVELVRALEYFKDATRAQGLTAQWLHGNMMPQASNFPLPSLGPALERARHDLEEKYGLFLFKGLPVRDRDLKDLHLMHAGIASHAGVPRPQTVFGELVQDIRDTGQAPLIERRGSKHNRALPFHNDPSDAITFLCIHPAQSGGLSLYASSVAIHNAMLGKNPRHVHTLYGDLMHSYQEYLFVRTGANRRFLPRKRYYPMPAFTSEQGKFACKYSRFYIDQAQEFPEVPRLTAAQREALEAFEAEMQDPKWHYSMQYEAGDLMFINNYVCFHARTAFADGALAENRRRHLLRIWLSMPNSRPLSRKWKRHVFYQQVGAGALRGGVPVPPVSYASMPGRVAQ